ncbi:hypothetical protein KW882_00935 [Vibrio parahaemolyticus]
MNKLPENYQQALLGLRMQSEYAVSELTDKKLPRDHLHEAHKLIANHKYKVHKIIEMAKEHKVSVIDITEEQLLDWLISNKDLSVSHLFENPFYYAACNTVEGKDYYFITTYFDDVMACAGHSECIDEVIEMMILSTNPIQLKSVESIPLQLVSKLHHPEMSSNHHE